MRIQYECISPPFLHKWSLPVYSVYSIPFALNNESNYRYGDIPHSFFMSDRMDIHLTGYIKWMEISNIWPLQNNAEKNNHVCVQLSCGKCVCGRNSCGRNSCK